MKRLFAGILILSGCLLQGRAQDKNILFSQYRLNGLSLNPAYAGSHDVFSASVLSRYQWIGFEGAPSNYALNMHFPGKNTKTGWGANMMYETIGIRSTMGLYINYAYRLTLGSGTLAMGLKGGFSSGHQDILDLSGDDPVYNDNLSGYFLPNFGVGLYYNSKKLFAGLSVPLMLGYETGKDGAVKAYHDFSKYAYYFTGGIHFNAGPDWLVTPSVLAQYDLSSGLVLDGTLSMLYKEMFGAGITYRTAGALVMMLSYRLGYLTTVGLAYDFGFGGINQFNRSSFEIALQIDLGFKINRSNPTVF
jgi:type IX secretion system PorP/SprF family membrane protein